MSIAHVRDYVIFKKEQKSVNHNGFFIADNTDEKIDSGLVVSSDIFSKGEVIFYIKDKANRLCDGFSENFAIDVKYVVAILKKEGENNE